MRTQTEKAETFRSLHHQSRIHNSESLDVGTRLPSGDLHGFDAKLEMKKFDFDTYYICKATKNNTSPSAEGTIEGEPESQPGMNFKKRVNPY